MRMPTLIAATIAAFLLLIPGAVRAERLASPAPFATLAEPDAVLAAISGGSAMLTRGKLTVLADRQSRDDFLATSGIARIEMDVWWGTTGAELIAQNVRATLP